MAEMDNVRNRLQSLSQSMTLGQKLSLGITTLLLVMGVVLLVRWASRPDFALLFSDLDLKEADEIVQSLQAENVPYKITQGGRTVLIPSKDVYEWRMQLASQGLPSSGNIGYEIFDQNEIGISNFVQQINFRRALEGELSRSIMEIGGIQSARVHIVLPEEKLFKEDEVEPTASIMLKMGRNAALADNRILGIANLVAASVEGLTPENVTIVDSRGNILTNQWKSDSMMGLSSTQLDLQKKVEEHLTRQAESMLAAVLGNNRAIVRVNARLNFERIERTDERYDPNAIAVLSEERTDETNEDAAEGGGTGQLEHSITNYHVPKTVEHIVGSVGDIERLSVAVLVDYVEEEVTDDQGETTTQYVPRSQEEMTNLTTVVQNAVGFDPARNDQFNIQSLKFDSNVPVEEPPEEPFYTVPEFWLNSGRQVLPFFILGILLLMLRSRLKKMNFGMPKVSTQAAAVQSLESAAAAVPIPKIDEGASPEVQASAKLSKQIAEFASDKPSMAARLLRYWMIEE